MCASTGVRMIVPSPAGRKINLKSHITTQTFTWYARYRYRLDPPDNSCFAHVPPQSPALIADQILIPCRCRSAPIGPLTHPLAIFCAPRGRAPTSPDARQPLRLVSHPCGALSENLTMKRGA
jgi:hypothetical protein